MNLGRRILVIGDDAVLRETLAEQLELGGEFHLLGASSAAAASEILREGPVAAVLQDDVADLDKPSLCRALRELGVEAPIFVLLAAEESALAAGLPEAGASEILAKPFKIGALLARLRAVPESRVNGEAGVIAIGRYGFRPSEKLLIDGSGRQIRLTEKETALLSFLHEAEGQVVARDTLLGAVWGYQSGLTTHTVETHVYRLRRKIERDPARSEILVTEPGGYRLLHAL